MCDSSTVHFKNLTVFHLVSFHFIFDQVLHPPGYSLLIQSYYITNRAQVEIQLTGLYIEYKCFFLSAEFGCAINSIIRLLQIRFYWWSFQCSDKISIYVSRLEYRQYAVRTIKTLNELTSLVKEETADFRNYLNVESMI